MSSDSAGLIVQNSCRTESRKKKSFRTQSPTDPTPFGPQTQPQRCKSAEPTEPQNLSCFVFCLLPVPQSHPRLQPITPANAAKKSPEMVVNLDDSSYAWLNAYMVGIRHSSEIQNVLVGPKPLGTVWPELQTLLDCPTNPKRRNLSPNSAMRSKIQPCKHWSSSQSSDFTTT